MIATQAGRSCPALVLVSRLAAATSALFLSAPARAHFVLQAPACYSEQNVLGDPQKDPPCGGNIVPTGAVTKFRPGQMITVTINEKIPHPGHYRIVLAANRNSLPPAPPVTKVGTDECGSTVIESNPTLPILADGVLRHTSPFNGPQSVQVKLPDNYTCSECTLQVIEYMSNHAAPCFYYHCAQISIQAEDGGTGAPDGGAADLASGGSPDLASGGSADLASSGADAGTSTPQPGCACEVSSRRAPAGAEFAGLLAVGLLWLRRRRRP